MFGLTFEKYPVEIEKVNLVPPPHIVITLTTSTPLEVKVFIVI